MMLLVTAVVLTQALAAPEDLLELARAAKTEPAPKAAALAQARCGAETQLSAWQGGVTVGLSHAAGARTACLVVVDQTLAGVSATIDAGWSDRYQEAFAPTILGVVASEDGPMVLFQITTMGGGGGGGEQLQAAILHRGKLVRSTFGTLGGATNINTLVEAPSCEDHLLRGGPRELRFISCFDGQPQPARRFTLKGGRYTAR